MFPDGLDVKGHYTPENEPRVACTYNLYIFSTNLILLMEALVGNHNYNYYKQDEERLDNHFAVTVETLLFPLHRKGQTRRKKIPK